MNQKAHGVDHYENFPVASFLCPPALRPAIMAIYWFARTADDLADEGDARPADRLLELAAYRADLQACVNGQATSSRWAAVFVPLRGVLEQHALPAHLLESLLSAFAQDVTKTRYASQAELLDYCQRSANPVGRLLLHLYRIHDDVALQQSDCICSALQLINFWQDLSVDIPRGRIYLPTDSFKPLVGPDAPLAAAQSLATQPIEIQLLQQSVNPATCALIAANLAWAQTLMQRGAPLVKKVPGRAGWELRLVVQGGLRIAEKIEGMGFATLRHRPKLNAWDGAVMLWRAVWM